MKKDVLETYREFYEKSLKEISQPHQCGSNCLCVAIRIQLDLINILLEKVEKEK